MASEECSFIAGWWCWCSNDVDIALVSVFRCFQDVRRAGARVYAIFAGTVSLKFVRIPVQCALRASPVNLFATMSVRHFKESLIKSLAFRLW